MRIIFLSQSVSSSVPPVILQEQATSPFNATVMNCDNQSSCCPLRVCVCTGSTLGYSEHNCASYRKSCEGRELGDDLGCDDTQAVQAHRQRMYSVV